MNNYIWQNIIGVVSYEYCFIIIIIIIIINFINIYFSETSWTFLLIH